MGDPFGFVRRQFGVPADASSLVIARKRESNVRWRGALAFSSFHLRDVLIAFEVAHERGGDLLACKASII
jgi:hypothetical protein